MTSDVNTKSGHNNGAMPKVFFFMKVFNSHIKATFFIIENNPYTKKETTTSKHTHLITQ